MTTNLTNNDKRTARPSTYSLLIQSEEKEHGYFEAAIYALFILCAVFSVWQFALQPVTIPAQLGGTTPQHVAAVATPAEVRS